jgi:gliding motility-associated-like protein
VTVARLAAISFAFIFLGLQTKSQIYEHLIVSSGFNHDVIANGPGPALNSTTAGVDSVLILANCLMSQDFQPTAAPPPAYALPLSGIITSAATAGLSFQLGPYTGNNSLWMNFPGSSTLTFQNQVAASQLYVLTTSGHFTSTANGIIHFTDNTTQNFGTMTIPDWFNGTTPPVTIQNFGRVGRASGIIENPANNPRIYQYSIIISAANVQKQIASIQFNKTNTTGVLNVFAVTAKLSPCPDLSLFDTDSIAICPGTDTLLDVTMSNAISYQWSTGSTVATSTVSTSGMHYVEVSTSQCVFNDSIMVTYLDVIDPFSIGNDTILCVGDNLVLEADNIQQGSYNWSTGVSSDWLLVSQSGTYWLEIANACNALRDSITINPLLPPQNFSLGADFQFCNGESVLLTTPLQQGMSYQWQNGSTATDFSVTTPGMYWLRLYNQCGTVGDTVMASVPAAPYVHLPNDTILCNNATWQLMPTVFNHTGVLWQDGSTQMPYLIHQPGQYTISVFNQCDTVSDALQVGYQTSPTVTLGSDLTPCDGESVTLTANGSEPVLVWHNGAFGSEYHVTQSGLYWVMCQNQCGIAIDTVEVRYVPVPRVQLGPDLLLCEEVVHEINFLPERADYLWNDGLTEHNRVISSPGTYWLSASNQCGQVTDSIEVAFQDCSCAIYLPNSFTPNGDDINDVFNVKYQCDFEEFVIRIYNRWGQLTFESFEPQHGWTGSVNGGDYFAPDGTYLYEVQYKLEKDIEPIILRGRIVLVR